MAPAPIPLEPLEPNPGGVVDPEDLVGRDAELGALLRHIPQGGAYVVGDRRMGKTSLVKKAAAELRAVGHTVVYASAETGDLSTFTTTLLAEIRREARLGAGIARWETRLDGAATLRIAGSGLRLSGSLKRSGEPVEDDLLRLCAEAVRAHGPHRLVLFIDEVAVLANALAAEDPAAGLEFLRSLRRSRQSLDNVTVVYAGSVGLHHAISDLSVINDLPEVEVGPLRHNDAVLLARRLMLGVFDADDATISRDVAQSCSDIPYYMQALVSRLRMLGPAPSETRHIESAVDDALAGDVWHTDHYFDRIDRYYGADGRLVITVMDALAEESSVRSLDSLLADINAADPLRRVERSALGQVLRRMQRDHYVTTPPGGYRVASPLLARIWRATRERR